MTLYNSILLVTSVILLIRAIFPHLDTSPSGVDSYEFALLQNDSLNASDILVHQLRIFDERLTLKFKRLRDVKRNILIGSIVENADVKNIDCYWSLETRNASAVLNTCKDEMVSQLAMYC